MRKHWGCRSPAAATWALALLLLFAALTLAACGTKTVTGVQTVAPTVAHSPVASPTSTPTPTPTVKLDARITKAVHLSKLALMQMRLSIYAMNNNGSQKHVADLGNRSGKHFDESAALWNRVSNLKTPQGKLAYRFIMFVKRANNYWADCANDIWAGNQSAANRAGKICDVNASRADSAAKAYDDYIASVNAQ
jgi:hypothetical protein